MNNTNSSMMSYRLGWAPDNPPQPNGFVPVPPVPNPVPNPNITNNTGQCYAIVYNKIENQVIDLSTANLLNGPYVSKNTNPIPESLTVQNLLNVVRYASGTTQNLSITDNNLALTTNVNIYFWVYVNYSNFVKPITILTKGKGNDFGEYTVQIMPNKLLSFLYTFNNTMNSIRSTSIIPEKTPVFVSIIKTVNSISIYLNNKLDTISYQSGVSTATSNPVLIGYGNNSNPFNGYLDNLMISTFPLDGIGFVSKYYSYVPNSLYFEFTNGVITYNGYNVALGITTPAPANNDVADLICTQLDGYSNGYCINTTYIYYMDYLSKISKPNGEINEKYTTLVMANSIFTRLKITTKNAFNVAFEDSLPLNGYIKTFAGEVFYFKDGVVFEFDITTNTLIPSQLTNNRADYLMSSISLVNAYRIAFGIFSFYYFVKESKVPSITPNKLVQKLKNYTMGGINTLIDYDGMCHNATYKFFNEGSVLNTGNSIRQVELLEGIETAPPSVLASSTKGSAAILNVASMDTNLFDSPKKNASLDNSNAIYIYTGQNIIPLMNKPSNIFVDNLPVLEKAIPVHVEFNKDVDIMGHLFANNITINRHVFMSCSLEALPGLYTISIISNTQSIITVGGQSYPINTNHPEHIVFHNSNTQITIEIKLYYNKLNQAAKFIIIKP